MRAEKAVVDRDRLYDDYWSRFESAWWDEEIRRGNQTSSRLDLLTRALLSSKLGAAIDVRRVHAAYTDWIETHSPYQTLEDELREFVTYGAYFEQLNGKSEGPLSSFGRRMHTWDTTTVFPLAIYLAAEGLLTSLDLSAALACIESFIVRRTVCELQSKEYNNFFVEVVSHLREDGASLQRLRETLSAGEGETRRFPTDEQFASAWKTKRVYGRLTSGQLTLMFQQLETHARSDRAEATPIPNMSVEHIMPQRWTDNYLLEGEKIPENMNTNWFFGTDEEEERYKRLRPMIQQRRVQIHSIGNLTAVTHPLNGAMRNVGFAEKKQYFRESVLALNRYFDRVMEWNEQAIQDRADRLFGYARTIWCEP